MTLLNISKEWHNSSMSANGTGDNPGPEVVGMVLPATLMAALIFITFQGNLWILAAIFTHPLLRSSSSSVFVISLMLLGLLASCLGLPVSLAVFVLGPDDIDPMLCNASGFFNTCFMMCSMLHLSLISIDRFYSIMLPMHHAGHATPTLYVAVALVTWCLSGGVSLMPLPEVFGNSHGFISKGCYCTFIIPGSLIEEVFICIIAVVSFFLPSLILITMYTGVFFMARKAAHTVIPHFPPPGQRQLRFQVPLTNQNNASSTHAWTVTEGTGQSDESQHRDMSALILIPASSPSAEPNGHRLYNGTASSRTTQAKTVSYPTAKVSPTKHRQTFPTQRPKAIDPSIFSVSSQTVPVVPANSRKSQTPKSHDTAKTRESRRSFAGGGDRNDAGEMKTPDSSSSHNIQPKTATVEPGSHIGFVCGCASRPTPGKILSLRRTQRSNASSSETSVTATHGGLPINQKMSKKACRSLPKPPRSPVESAVTYTHNRSRPSYAKAVRTVMIIVLSFFAFWGLHFVSQLRILFHGRHWSEMVHIFATWLGFASYGVNPYLYGYMNRQIREEMTGIFKGLRERVKICCCCCFWACYRRFVTPQPSHADGMWACCVPPRQPSDDTNGDHVDGFGEGGESFFQFLQRTQDSNTPVPKSVFQSEH